MQNESIKKFVVGFTYILNLMMLVTAIILMTMILITGVDPAKRLSSHVATIALTFLPMLIYTFKKEKLNLFLYLFTAIYVFIAVFLGASLNFYNMYEHINYDKLVHVFFGYSSTLIGLYILIKTNKLNTSSLFFNLLFLFSFAMMISAVWEIFEFSSDQFFHTTTQGRPQVIVGGGSLVDVGETMFDIISNLIGALIFMLQLTWYYKTKKAPIMNFMINELSK